MPISAAISAWLRERGRGDASKTLWVAELVQKRTAIQDSVNQRVSAATSEEDSDMAQSRTTAGSLTPVAFTLNLCVAVWAGAQTTAAQEVGELFRDREACPEMVVVFRDSFLIGVARAGTQTAHYWGESVQEQCRHANGCNSLGLAETGLDHMETDGCRDGQLATAPVGSFQPNPIVRYDVFGNVSERVNDCWNADHDGVLASRSAPNQARKGGIE